jgi:PhoPQ-activated pathogenicity-related protein
MTNILRTAGLALAIAVAACTPSDDAAVVDTATPETGVGSFPTSVAESERTPLDAYIDKPEDVYGWTKVNSFEGDGFTGHVLELTSQTWRSETEVDRTVWKHWITIVEPDAITSDAALLYITGGANDNDAPGEASERSIRMATETGSITAELFMVPNQPVYFTDTPDQARYEDDLIAYTRDKHFKTKDDQWLVRLAMVKSGVKAMDAMQEYLATDEGGATDINRFVVSGASKRGWTTWLVGAVDTRVIGIIPLVIDALNSEEITRHHYEVLGFFAPSLGDYVHHGLFPHMMGTPEYRAVLEIEDPYEYFDRGRLQLPKFIVNASGDQYFHPDNSRFYYDAMPDEKRLRYVPNAAHNLAGSDAVDSMIAFYQAVITGAPRPDYSWTTPTPDSIHVTTDTPPREVTLWQAHNPETRDFRVEHLGNAYTPTILTPESDGTYIARVESPEVGFTAFFVEMTYDGAGPQPFKFTTGVSIIPDTVPFRWEDAAAQYADTLGGENPE